MRKIQEIDRKLFCFDIWLNTKTAETLGGIKTQNRDFRQKRFGFCQRGTANSHFF